jgi:hypothetical protein
MLGKHARGPRGRQAFPRVLALVEISARIPHRASETNPQSGARTLARGDDFSPGRQPRVGAPQPVPSRVSGGTRPSMEQAACGTLGWIHWYCESLGRGR